MNRHICTYIVSTFLQNDANPHARAHKHSKYTYIHDTHLRTRTQAANASQSEMVKLTEDSLGLKSLADRLAAEANGNETVRPPPQTENDS
jgi:hypothetical protein